MKRHIITKKRHDTEHLCCEKIKKTAVIKNNSLKFVRHPMRGKAPVCVKEDITITVVFFLHFEINRVRHKQI